MNHPITVRGLLIAIGIIVGLAAAVWGVLYALAKGMSDSQ
jgi:hypothetical protein